MENYIKMDGEPDSFEGGATRYSKRGKGRYDLIPGGVIPSLIAWADLEVFKDEKSVSISLSDLFRSAYTNNDDIKYLNTLFDFILYEYCNCESTDKGYIVSYNEWLYGLNRAIKDIAIHYEFGAEKYGVDNWKNGIPITGGDRGGSFTDSGLRHLQQYIAKETDEKHGVAFMWNFVNAIYLQRLECDENEFKKAYHEKQNLKEVIGDTEPYEFKD